MVRVPPQLHHHHNPTPAGAELDRLRGMGGCLCSWINTRAGCRACRGCLWHAHTLLLVGQGQRLPRSMEERGREGEEKEGGSDECGTVDSRLKYSARF